MTHMKLLSWVDLVIFLLQWECKEYKKKSDNQLYIGLICVDSYRPKILSQKMKENETHLLENQNFDKMIV